MRLWLIIILEATIQYAEWDLGHWFCVIVGLPITVVVRVSLMLAKPF